MVVWEQQKTCCISMWIIRKMKTFSRFGFKILNGFMRIGSSSLEIPEDIGLTTLYWKHKMLEDDFKRYSAFWNSTNDTLSQAFEKLRKQDEELRERTAELLQANTQLHQEIAERKQAQKRIERLNQLKEDLLGPLSLDEKLKHITDGIVIHFRCRFCPDLDHQTRRSV